MLRQTELQFIEDKAGKTCRHCGGEVVGRSDKVYCSKKCKTAIRPEGRIKARGDRSCPHCGKDVTGRAHKVYCSNKCCSAAQNKAAREKRAKAKAGRSCPECGEEVVGKSGKVYCSKKCCYDAWRKANREKRNKARRKKSPKARREKSSKAMVAKSCPTCGGDVVGPAGKIYCSSRCSNTAWRKANPERRKELAERYREANREKINESYRKHYKANPEKIRAKVKKWKKNNPEKRKAQQHRRRARIRGNGVEDTSDYRARMTHPLVRQVCFYCGKDCTGGKWHWEHRIPLAAGGPEAEWNLVIACPPCNLKKGAKVPKTLFAEEIFNEP